MRKVVAYELLSFDGVAERPDDFIIDFDDAMAENLGRVIATQDAVLFGRLSVTRTVTSPLGYLLVDVRFER